MKRKSVRGGAITFTSQAATTLIQLASAAVLGRILSPADYGVVAMVAAATAFAGLFRDLGLSSASIQQHRLTRAQQSNLFWINVACGASLSLVLAASAPVVSWFYGRPDLMWVTVAMSLIIAIRAVATQSGVLLAREMRFGSQAIATTAGAAAGLAFAVVLASNGFGYWSLVWSQLLSALVAAVLLVVLSPFRPGWPSWGSGVRDLLRFGANVAAFDLINYFQRNLDNVLVGRFWGAEALGIYSRAYALLMFPIANLRGPMIAVALPAMSRLRDQPSDYRAYYVRMTTLLATLSMPLSAFGLVAADQVVEILLGPGWSGVAQLFGILALVSFIQPVVTLWGVVALSSGQSGRYLRVGTINAACSAAGFCIGVPWGPRGVALGYVAATYLTVYPVLRWTFIGTPLRCADFVCAVSRPFIASAVATAVCALVVTQGDDSDAAAALAARLAYFLPCYCATYVALPGGWSELRRVAALVVRLKRP